MKVLVVGTGAREHAIADALKDDVELYCYMSKVNPGMSKIAEFKQGDEGEVEKVAQFAKENDIEDMANEIEKRNKAFLIYQDENGIARVNVRFEGEDVWLNVEQMMKLFDASRQDVSYHINQIYAENEQDPERTRKIFLTVRQEGSRSVWSR